MHPAQLHGKPKAEEAFIRSREEVDWVVKGGESMRFWLKLCSISSSSHLHPSLMWAAAALRCSSQLRGWCLACREYLQSVQITKKLLSPQSVNWRRKYVCEELKSIPINKWVFLRLVYFLGLTYNIPLLLFSKTVGSNSLHNAQKQTHIPQTHSGPESSN